MRKVLLSFLTIIMALAVNAQIELRQASTSLMKADDEVQIVVGEFDEVPEEGSLLLAFLAARTADSGLFTPHEDTEGWEFFDDAIGQGRIHVFYKWAEFNDETHVAFDFHTPSRFVMVIAEFTGVESIDTDSIAKTILGSGVTTIGLGPLDAVAGQVAVAGIGVRALDLLFYDEDNDGSLEVLTELSWTNDFIMIGDTTAEPVWNPLTIGVAYYDVTEDAEISTEVSWEDQDDVQPSGIMFLLNPKDEDDTSVWESNGIPSFEMFPVPASDKLRIRNMEQAESVSIVNITGQVVAQQAVTGKEVVIDVSSISAGIYIVSILEHNGNVTSKKLVIE